MSDAVSGAEPQPQPQSSLAYGWLTVGLLSTLLRQPRRLSELPSATTTCSKGVP